MKKSASALFGLLMLCLVLPSISQADVTCAVPGTVPITDRSLARAAGIPDDQPCWNPNDPSIGMGAAEAKKYLLSIAHNLRDSKAPPNAAHIEPLNSAFAVCSAKFLKAYAQNYGPVYVVSAFRCGPRSASSLNCDRTENAQAGGAINSHHQTGTAMDINPAGGNSSYETLKRFADANPGFGVHFPWPQYNGSTDKPHMQARNTSSPSCDGVSGVPITPGPGGGDWNDQGMPPPEQQSPMQQLMAGLKNFFSQPPPEEDQEPAAYPNDNNPGSYPQGGGNPSGSGGSSQGTGSGSSGTGSTGGGSGSGGGNTSTDSGSDTGSNSSTGGISDLIDENDGSNPGSSNSAIDKIKSIANPTTTSATSTTVGKSVALNDTLSNKSTLAGTLASSSVSLAAGTTTYSLDPVASQTFVSQDLSKTPVQPFSFSSNSTFGVLENIKSALLYIVQMLQPFGGAAPRATINTTTAVLE